MPEPSPAPTTFPPVVRLHLFGPHLNHVAQWVRLVKIGVGGGGGSVVCH